MDARTQKRIASVQHVKQKSYYRRLSEEPDPTATCSTRLWKGKMKVWVRALRAQADPFAQLAACNDRQKPVHGAAAMLAQTQGRHHDEQHVL